MVKKDIVKKDRKMMSYSYAASNINGNKKFKERKIISDGNKG